MRLFLDYRPALRVRTGVGEWVHQLARSLLRLRTANDPVAAGVHLTLFTSSWRDRPDSGALAELPGATVVDRRLPVRLLNLAWNRAGWPPAEWLAGRRFDIVHATTPLLVPCRSGRRVVTIYDLDFLHHPERAWGEMRRDFPALVHAHARRADLVVTISAHSAAAIERVLGVSPDRIVICRPGVPDWALNEQTHASPRAGGYLLFVGTLEPRKNVGGLLDAYERLLTLRPDAPPLVVAGRHTAAAEAWLARIARPPLRGHVEVRGFVPGDERCALYRGAAALVLPSLDEGFGLPALEAMALGVPVIGTTRGAVPEVVGDAGLLADPEDPAGLALAMQRVLSEPGLADALRAAGRARSGLFNWAESARTLLDRYRRLLGPDPGLAPRAA